MAKGYWIAHVDVQDLDDYRPYVAANPAILARYGGRFLVRGGAFEPVEGQSRSRTVIVEFPDYATALACSPVTTRRNIRRMQRSGNARPSRT